MILQIFALCLLNLFSSTFAGTNCQDLKIQSIDQLPQAYLKTVDKSFYKKFVSANGIPIMSSKDVSDYALKESARIIRGVTDNFHPGFLAALIEKTERVALWASNSTACSIPEVAKPCDLDKFRGGLAFGYMLILQETGFKCDDRGNAWIGRVLVHEFQHGVNGVFEKVDKKLQSDLEKAHKNAKDKGIWPPDWYGMSSWAEFFAGAGQAWFEANEMDCHKLQACDKNQLQKKDRLLYEVAERVYKSSTWLYKCAEFCDP